MRAWIQTALNITGSANSTRVDAAKPVGWADKKSSMQPPLMQPEHWVFNFGGPNEIIQADYWRGNRSIGITATANGFLATLTNMHKGTGMSIPWILLVDTLASSMIFLSISGVLLWVQTNRKRAVGVAIFFSRDQLDAWFDVDSALKPRAINTKKVEKSIANATDSHLY